jgi:hypothetical protein
MPVPSLLPSQLLKNLDSVPVQALVQVQAALVQVQRLVEAVVTGVPQLGLILAWV